MLHILVFDDSDFSTQTFTCADDEYQLFLGSGLNPEIHTIEHANGTIQLTITKGA